MGPVLALLAGTQAECERIIAQAQRDAGELAAEAGTRVAAIAADAARRAAAAREEAARRVMAAARTRPPRPCGDAEQQAAGTRALAGAARARPGDRAVGGSGGWRRTADERRVGRGQRAGQGPGPAPHGSGAARQLAACGSLRRCAAGAGRHALRRGTSGRARRWPRRSTGGRTLLWDLRVLAGWLPQDGVRLLRCSPAGSSSRTSRRCSSRSRAGRPDAEFELGALATAWPRLRQATASAGCAPRLPLRPGRIRARTAPAVRLGMRVRWAARVAAGDGPDLAGERPRG